MTESISKPDIFQFKWMVTRKPPSSKKHRSIVSSNVHIRTEFIQGRVGFNLFTL